MTTTSSIRRALIKQKDLAPVAAAAGVTVMTLEAYALDEKLSLPPKVLERLARALFGANATFDHATGSIRMAASGDQR